LDVKIKMSPTTFDMVVPSRPLTQRYLGVHRKNYLETYAKQRANGERARLHIAQQPVAGMDIVALHQTVKPAVTVADDQPYLQALIRRHQAAVAAAPDAENTILASLLSADTSDLFEYSIPTGLQAPTAAASHIRTIIMSAIVCGILASSIYGIVNKPTLPINSAHAVAQQQAVVNATTQPQSLDPLLLPSHLQITSLALNAPIQNLGLTASGAIDVPKGYGDIGWYQESSAPGKKGPVVLVGHYAGGSGAVFDNLHRLENGALITITNKKGEVLEYKVSNKAEYDRGQVPMQKILKDGNDSRLEIITCSGPWDTTTYAKRLIVSAVLVK
jgi:LPXTG-site transpeptidase (sortase) family protein